MKPILILPAILLLAAAVPAAAHPLPTFNFDRTVHVRINPAGVEVKYTLEVSLLAMTIDSKGLFTRDEEAEIGGRQREYTTKYGQKKARLIADELRATLNDANLKFTARLTDIEYEASHVKFRYLLTAPWTLAAQAENRFRFEDQNYEDKPGALTVTIAVDSPLEPLDVIEPTDLRGKSPLNLTMEEMKRLRIVSAVLKPRSAPAPPAAIATQPDSGPQVSGIKDNFLDDVRSRGFMAFFDSGYGTGMLLLFAALFGAGHALTPGHGKTLVAAYLVGERGTMGHACLLGLTTTIAHTGSVIIVAGVLWYAYRDGVPASAQGWLQLAGGLLILVVGLWLLLQRLRGKADHVHLFGDHHHHHHGHDHHHHHGHSHVHTHPEKPTSGRAGWFRVAMLGVAGGMIPCWDAVMLLLFAISAGKLAMAVPLLLAFSAGLSAVLIALGIAVVLATRAGGARYGESRWFQLLPIISAALLVVAGLWLCRDGFRSLDAATPDPTARTS